MESRTTNSKKMNRTRHSAEPTTNNTTTEEFQGPRTRSRTARAASVASETAVVNELTRGTNSAGRSRTNSVREALSEVEEVRREANTVEHRVVEPVMIEGHRVVPMLGGERVMVVEEDEGSETPPFRKRIPELEYESNGDVGNDTRYYSPGGNGIEMSRPPLERLMDQIHEMLSIRSKQFEDANER